MTNEARKTFPALRCSMGDWYYYVAYMKFSDVAHWIQSADEIYKSETLRDMVQREIGKRVDPIVKYLVRQDERFFNAIVVGVYEGAPQWYPIEVEDSPVLGSPNLDDMARQSIGLLVLEGSERLFAIDGQHRVEAIRRALKESPELGDEDLSTIFVAHGTDEKGQTRTRRLFSTLNRYAVPVSKGEIIALDEDDAFAIVTRRLLEDFNLLNIGFTIDKKKEAGFVLFGKTAPIPAKNRTSATSMLALYDIIEIIHIPLDDSKKRRSTIEELGHKRNRPEDHVLETIFEEQVLYWRLLEKHIPEYRELFGSSPGDRVAGKYRTRDGGHLMFRPMGQKTFARAARIMMDRGNTMEDAIIALSSVAMDLNAPPWQHVLWLPSTRRMNSKMSPVLGESIFLYCIGQKLRRKSYDLLNEYRKVLGDPEAELPSL